MQLLVRILLCCLHLVCIECCLGFEEVELCNKVLRIGVVEHLVALVVQSDQVCILVNGVQR